MAAIAAFATSDKGRFYLSLCERFRRDPAAGIEDEVVAFNLLAALTVGALPAEEPEAEILNFPDGHTEVKGLNPFG